MNTDAFRHLYGYHFAENRALWDRYILQLTGEQFTQAEEYSRGSIRDQIVHLMDVDAVWFSELRGVEPPEALAPLPGDDRERIRAHWDGIEHEMRAYLSALSDAMLFTQPIQEPAEDRALYVGRCYCTWSITAPIIAPKSSACCMIRASRQRRKITSSTRTKPSKSPNAWRAIG